jgi:hypothetical protein
MRRSHHELGSPSCTRPGQSSRPAFIRGNPWDRRVVLGPWQFLMSVLPSFPGQFPGTSTAEHRRAPPSTSSARGKVPSAFFLDLRPCAPHPRARTLHLVPLCGAQVVCAGCAVPGDGDLRGIRPGQCRPPVHHRASAMQWDSQIPHHRCPPIRLARISTSTNPRVDRPPSPSWHPHPSPDTWLHRMRGSNPNVMSVACTRSTDGIRLYLANPFMFPPKTAPRPFIHPPPMS